MSALLTGRTVLVVGRGPSTIDTGAYDALGEQKKTALFAARTERNPARRIGTSEDIADAVVFALTNTFLTGVSLGV
ncbi:MAG TPA: hypothetical protein VE287_03100, partial [Actinopolymorphaceae bacterium]|nr:hypothetical protein [Actinopolymorphaceae bacterium]